MDHLCNSCNLKVICKVYEEFNKFISKNPIGIKASINSCLYKNKPKNTKVEPVDDKNNKDSFDSYIDKILDNKVKELDKAKEINSKSIGDDILNDLDKEEVVVDGVTKTLYICPNCKTKDYKDGLFYCFKCNKLVCNNCGVFDNTSNSKVCEDCW